MSVVDTRNTRTLLWRQIIVLCFCPPKVDILVGWHIDSSQKPSVRLFTSQALLKWHTFWIIDLEFSSGLLKQFIEDVEAFTDDVQGSNPDGGGGDVQEVCHHILAVIQVFNTVLSCLRSTNRTVSFLPPESATWFDIVHKVNK